MLRSDLCDYSDAYIVVKERIRIRGPDNANRIIKKLTFRNNAPFRSCISKINNTFIDNAEDLDTVMAMYNLLELDLRWTKNCVISEISRTFRAVGDSPVQEVTKTATGATFQTNNTKLYVPVVTLSINDNVKFLKNIKHGFEKNNILEQIYI